MCEDYAVINNGAPEIRDRAEFPEWSMNFDIKYNASVYSVEQIVTFFNFGESLSAWAIGERKKEVFSAHIK